MRIFWLGMHKILVKTELPRLRQLGFEVFNPPYLSTIPDQSANLSWDTSQPTTLPANVFKALSEHNFFYNPATKEIGDILNQYFDAIVVTIHPLWLSEILKVYRGKVIYRTYGQVETVSNELTGYGVVDNILARDNFYYVPHSLKTLNGEHQWLKDLAIEAPYCLLEDIFQYENSYKLGANKRQIMVGCPNIDNGFYWHHFNHLKENLNHPDFKFYGVQLREVNDPQLAGTISREALIESFQTASGYFYTYEDSRVCYLPPIEMMVIGGPVIFLKNSLMDRYHETASPGRAESYEDALVLCRRLLDGDLVLSKAIIDSQKEIWERYKPAYVWPKFDQVFSSLLNAKNSVHSGPKQKVLTDANSFGGSHFIDLCGFDESIQFDGEQYFSKNLEGEWLLRAMPSYLKQVTNPVFVCQRKNLDKVYGAFNSEGVKYLVLDQFFDNSILARLEAKIKAYKLKIQMKRVGAAVAAGKGFERLEPSNLGHIAYSHAEISGRKFSNKGQFLALHFILFVALQVAGPAKDSVRWFKGLKGRLILLIKSTMASVAKKRLPVYRSWVASYQRFSFIRAIGKAQGALTVLNAPYVHNSQLLFAGPVSAIIPQFTPQFYIETGDFGHLRGSIAILKQLLARTTQIFTSAPDAGKHLTNSLLEIPAEKLKILPSFSLKSRTKARGRTFEGKLPFVIKKPYIFIPIAAAPNVRLRFLINAFLNSGLWQKFDLVLNDLPFPGFAELVKSHPGIEAVQFINQTPTRSQLAEIIKLAQLIVMPIENSYIAPVEFEISMDLNKSIVSGRFVGLNKDYSRIKIIDGFLLDEWSNALVKALNSSNSNEKWVSATVLEEEGVN